MRDVNRVLALMTMMAALSVVDGPRPAVADVQSFERVGPFAIDRLPAVDQRHVCVATLRSSSGTLRIGPDSQAGYAITIFPRAGLPGLEALTSVKIRLDQRGQAKAFQAERSPRQFKFLLAPEDMVRLQTLRHVVIMELGDNHLRWPLGGTPVQALVSALDRCANHTEAGQRLG